MFYTPNLRWVKIWVEKDSGPKTFCPSKMLVKIFKKIWVHKICTEKNFGQKCSSRKFVMYKNVVAEERKLEKCPKMFSLKKACTNKIL